MPLILWGGFVVFVLLMLALDTKVLHRHVHTLAMREASSWTAGWISLAMVFNFLVYLIYERRWFGMGIGQGGAAAAQQFFAGWLVETSLSLDNLLIFALIFGYFKVPSQYQHRVLVSGVVGALILRGAVIGAGAVLLNRFVFVHFVFAVLLIGAALKMLFFNEDKFDPSSNWLLRVGRAVYPISEVFDRERFFTMLADGRKAATPLFLVLLVVESTDVLFAVDSIPAVFGITRDPFIVYTSNIFAVLGLRALYFVLLALLLRFKKLKFSLAGVLFFISIKMLLEGWLDIPTPISVAALIVLLTLGVAASIVVKGESQ